MKPILSLLLLLLLSSNLLFAQNEYEPSAANPFGLANPLAPPELKDYQPLIGICDCKSFSRNQDGSWAEAVAMTWEFKYIMNGMAVQDQTLKVDGKHSGSIRQYSSDSSAWYVHYFSSAAPSPSLGTWKGGMEGDEIVLYKPQKAPNGTDGMFKITFSEISAAGFNWLGQWVSMDESVKFPTWKIECTKQKTS
ncbi:hypothetical protein [Algoriphagus chordae]|uniref:Secreted protein n=1 Tax=Algoriphagus chordae TaxID=237019 RepID=A0A2W7R9M2_9BACT|nr:hypothetical protein [Algoriphagus chordae]PZX55836.1 hypothetical protein LV85_01061 [Algoriphagus chordae]